MTMEVTMKFSSNDLISIDNGFFRVAILTTLILLLPLVAMRFTSEVSWSRADFIVMGVFCIIVGSLFVLACRAAPKRRFVLGLVFVFIFVYIWAELAVGIFTSFGS